MQKITMTKMISIQVILVTIASLLLANNATATTGKPHSTVQTLTTKNFNEALNDPANGLWLLKFYAPWCGHCKKLAPTLDAMAKYITGKFAIGKIDCTTETSLCKSSQFNIRGYPTLKIYKDGNFYDYPGKRDADSMIEFMEKMSLPSVTLVDTYDDFIKNVLDVSSDGVAFLAFDSKGKEIDINKQNQNNHDKKTIHQADLTPVEKIMSSTKFLQMYGQSSRVLQSISSFALLHPKHKSELSKFLHNESTLSTKISPSNQMLLRIEKNIAPIVYNHKREKDLHSVTSSDIVDWVKQYYMPLVTTLEGHNFRTVTALGKPLVIGITNPKDDDHDNTEKDEATNTFLHELRTLAQFGPEDIIQKYKFSQMNGKKFHSFLKQFNISSDSKFPQAIVVNVQTRNYYQNDTFVTIQDFINGVESGLIEEQQSDNNNNSLWNQILNWFVKFMPYSAIMATVVLALFCWFVVMIIGGDGSDDMNNGEKIMLTETELKILQQRREMERKVKKKTLKED